MDATPVDADGVQIYIGYIWWLKLLLLELFL
jgi:hypothetical protein